MKTNSLYLLCLVVLCGVASCTKLVDTSTKGLVLYYTFDGDLKDLSGNNNHGIDFTSGNYVKGKWGNALDFNGVSDHIELSNTLACAEGLSFSFWARSRGANSDQNNGAIVSKYNMAGHQRCFMIFSFGANETRSHNRLSAAFYVQSNTAATNDMVKSYYEPDELSLFPDPSIWTLVRPQKLELNVWTHCVINVTPTVIEAWINGELCVKKKREYQEYHDNPDLPTFIGNNMWGGSGSNNHFNGALDELRIYSRALAKKEIQFLFRNK